MGPRHRSFTYVNALVLCSGMMSFVLEGHVGRRCCLILEDQALIGLALEASLEEAGFSVAGPFGKSADALHWLGERTPDLALIDVLLKDGPCLPVARELRKRRVPFAIYSGL